MSSWKQRKARSNRIHLTTESSSKALSLFTSPSTSSPFSSCYWCQSWESLSLPLVMSSSSFRGSKMVLRSWTRDQNHKLWETKRSETRLSNWINRFSKLNLRIWMQLIKKPLRILKIKKKILSINSNLQGLSSQQLSKSNMRTRRRTKKSGQWSQWFKSS